MPSRVYAALMLDTDDGDPGPATSNTNWLRSRVIND
jgi:hypothetical protein